MILSIRLVAGIFMNLLLRLWNFLSLGCRGFFALCSFSSFLCLARSSGSIASNCGRLTCSLGLSRLGLGMDLLGNLSGLGLSMLVFFCKMKGREVMCFRVSWISDWFLWWRRCWLIWDIWDNLSNIFRNTSQRWWQDTWTSVTVWRNPNEVVWRSWPLRWQVVLSIWSCVWTESWRFFLGVITVEECICCSGWGSTWICSSRADLWGFFSLLSRNDRLRVHFRAVLRGRLLIHLLWCMVFELLLFILTFLVLLIVCLYFFFFFLICITSILLFICSNIWHFCFYFFWSCSLDFDLLLIFFGRLFSWRRKWALDRWNCSDLWSFLGLVLRTTTFACGYFCQLSTFYSGGILCLRKVYISRGRRKELLLAFLSAIFRFGITMGSLPLAVSSTSRLLQIYRFMESINSSIVTRWAYKVVFLHFALSWFTICLWWKIQNQRFSISSILSKYWQVWCLGEWPPSAVNIWFLRSHPAW